MSGHFLHLLQSKERGKLTEKLEKLSVEELEQLVKEARKAYRAKERSLKCLVEVDGGVKIS